MDDYLDFISKELILKLSQVRQFIRKHNPTIGIVTEEILRQFLKEHFPKAVSVEQGFIRNKNGQTSRQCDIIIYDSSLYAPFYRINDIVVIPAESVIAVVEVKTTLTSEILHKALDSIKELKSGIHYCPVFLFVYNGVSIDKLSKYFYEYGNLKGSAYFDHDTFEFLPDEITGIDESYHLKQDYVIGDSDTKGYSSYFFENEMGTEISALQNFYLSLYKLVEAHLAKTHHCGYPVQRGDYFQKHLKNYRAFSLFQI